MPQIDFKDRVIEREKLRDRQTWFTDAEPKSGYCRYPGLRLCISKKAKTFYVAKWDGTKTRQKKLKPHSKNYPVAMAWRDAQAVVADIENPQSETEELPTLREAVEEHVTYRLNLNPRVGKPMTQQTATKYRNAIKQHLSKWSEVRIDELPTLDIRRHLNRLQASIPYGAQYAHTAIGAAIRFQNGERDLDLKVPGLTTVTKTGKADVNRDVSWKDRWDEIEVIKNPWIRAAWKFRWLTGVRVTAFHKIRWDDVNFDFGTVALPDDKGVDKRVIGVADAVLDVLRDLPRINQYVFASDQRPGQGHIYEKLDRLDLNVAQHMRHLWHDVLEQTECSRIVAHWLAGQNDADIQGHYTIPPVGKQRDAANAIATCILTRATQPSKVENHLDAVMMR